MNIIIIGCGKVGTTIAEELSEENHNIVLVDKDAAILQSIPENLDALRICGNGSSIGTLMEAGVESADILIAVTGSDELNLLCCLIAKKASACHAIARVRDPSYSQELDFLKEKLGISMIINPEQTAAEEIARLLSFPSAIRIDTFAENKVELIKFRILPEFRLDRLTVANFAAKFKMDLLICAVERGDEVTIPDGNFTLLDGDVISILAEPKNAVAFFKEIGLKTDQVRNALIVGGGEITYYLAGLLNERGVATRIIEKKRSRCEELSDLLPFATIIEGDGTDRQLLLEEGLQNAESFLAVTDMDEENILLSLFAKSSSDAKLITKVNKLAFTDIINNLDIGSVIYPKHLTADRILQYVRATNNSMGSNVETLYQIINNRAEALEFAIREKSAATGVPLSELQLKENLRIGCINRGGKIIIPRGQDKIMVGDTVIVVTSHLGLSDIEDILRHPRKV